MLKNSSIYCFTTMNILIVIFCTLLPFACGKYWRYKTSFLNETVETCRECPEVSEGRLRCGKGLAKKDAIPLSRQQFDSIVHDGWTYESCTKIQSTSVCQNLLHSVGCTAEYRKCLPPTQKLRACWKETVFLSRANSTDADENFHEEINGSSEGGNSRARRTAPSACVYPKQMRTADVSCTTTANKVKCEQNCIFGHTLPDGIKQSLVCIKGKNQWLPSKFAECKPFVDCTLSLVSSGSIDCYTATTSYPPLCYVQCNEYEDKKAVNRKAYECKIDGSWSYPLPFCAARGSGMAIVRAPNSQLHPHFRSNPDGVAD